MKKLCILISAVIAFSMGKAQQKEHNMDNIVIVIHGGAGTILKKNMTPEKEKAYEAKLREALEAGYAILKEGGSSVEAVEAAIHVMEDSPLFNAGKGAVFTHEETNEMDASIMDGKTLNAGAVAGVQRIRNPISGARKVMEESVHVMMSGDGADRFAKEKGLEVVDPEYFRNEIRLKQLRRVKEREESILDHDSEDRGENLDTSETEFNINIDPDKKYGTVGCVALDANGNLAAGTSTGGMTNKRWGRIGDSPIIAAGTYANNKTCAVSCTGHGEFFIRYVVAYDISAWMEYRELPLEDAANFVIHEKLEEVDGRGGVICVDQDGNIAMPFNTAGMYRGYMRADGKANIAIYGEE